MAFVGEVDQKLAQGSNANASRKKKTFTNI
jgi:hypothetical protein